MVTVRVAGRAGKADDADVCRQREGDAVRASVCHGPRVGDSAALDRNARGGKVAVAGIGGTLELDHRAATAGLHEENPAGNLLTSTRKQPGHGRGASVGGVHDRGRAREKLQSDPGSDYGFVRDGLRTARSR